MLQPGQTCFHRYEIVKLIGKRESSQIYRATDRVLERTVALKVFENIPDEPTMARIEREAKIYIHLGHPHIARLYDVIQKDETFCFVLEFIEGQNLAEKLRVESPALRQILTWQSELLQALKYLHSVSVIHRDIKPTNILIRFSDSSIKLSDFGTSKIKGTDDELTAVGSLVGTVLYAAPEQIQGAPVAPAVDIYAAGAVLYEMLTGRLPFSAPGVPLSHEQINEITEIRPATPRTVVDLIAGMTSFDASQRPSAGTALETLESIIAGIDWDQFEDGGIKSASVVRSLAPSPIIPQERIQELSATVVLNAPDAKPTGFFADHALRLDAYKQSVQFFRSHLDNDYKNLLNQAKLAFALWLVCAAIAFAVLITGVALLFQGSTTNGAITLASDVLVLFIQKVFKDREEYYREQANQKHKHLQMGNAWTLAVQSLDGIADPVLREQKLGALSDALLNAFGPNLLAAQESHRPIAPVKRRAVNRGTRRTSL